MITNSQASEFGPSILGVLKRYLPLIVASAVALGVVGAALPLVAPDDYVAVATIVVEDPSAVTLFDSLAPDSTSDAERYVNDQAAILSSTPIVSAALESIKTVNPERPESTDEMLEMMDVVVDDSSNVINIQYASGDADFSIEAVNSVLAAYESFVEDRRSVVYSNAIDELDASVTAAQEEIDTIQAEIDLLLRGSESRLELDHQFQQLIDRLAVLQRIPTSNVDQTAEIVAIVARLDALKAVNAVEEDLPELRPLVDRRTEAIRRESELLSRRDGLTVDAQLQQSGVALVAPAISAESVGRSPILAGMAGIVLGVVLGAAAAYWLSQSRLRFEHRMQPEGVLGVALLGDIPRLSTAHEVAVIDQPTSGAAHAFRALASVLQQNIPSLRITPASIREAKERSSRGAVLALVSARRQEDRTLTALNTAVSAARGGLRVLLIDGDLESRLALPKHLEGQGGGELATEVSEPQIFELEIDDNSKLDVLGWGLSTRLDPSSSESRMFLDQVPDPDVLGTAMFRDRVSELAEHYDLVLLDVPGLLGSAPAADAVRLADSALIVIAHHSLSGRAAELRHRLSLIGVGAIGYVYTNPQDARIRRSKEGWRANLTRPADRVDVP